MSFTLSRRHLDPRTLELRVQQRGAAMSVRELVATMRASAPFREFLADALAGAGWEGFFWELAPLSLATLEREAEMVVVHGPSLAHLRPEPEAFAQHFAARPHDDVVAFPNLGGDALLVVPTPRAPHDAYPHLGAFLRRAPPAQIDALFRVLAESIAARASERPLWVSSAGLGVSWLHLRLDSTPKYYRHAPYRRA